MPKEHSKYKEYVSIQIAIRDGWTIFNSEAHKVGYQGMHMVGFVESASSHLIIYYQEFSLEQVLFLGKSGIKLHALRKCRHMSLTGVKFKEQECIS